jgi:hypothetical protein
VSVIGVRARFEELAHERPPLPAKGSTPLRLHRIYAVAEEDLSLAKLVEGHWDAVAILAEAGRAPTPGVTYGVWASEIPGMGLGLTSDGTRYLMNGKKPFCSGLGIVDRALVTVKEPRPLLLDVDMRQQRKCVQTDTSSWATEAFRETKTGAVIFENYSLSDDSIVSHEDFYLTREGFWHGACGPAACWAGGAAGLLTFARNSKRDDPHTLAHLGAMESSVWAMQAAVQRAGVEIDSGSGDAMKRALMLRHAVEQSCTEILRRFARTYGPHPLAMVCDISRRYQELDLYLRQCHAERDLEVLGRLSRQSG